jgi:transposase
MLWGGGEEIASIVADVNPWSPPMQELNDLSQSRIVLKQDNTLIAVIEMSLSSWLVAGIVPGVERQPLKKLAVDESALLKLLHRWREEAEKTGRRIERIAVAFETGRDGFWLARWLRARGIEAHVIHASSVAVSREHRRAKTDRLDTELLKRVFLGWLRGERDHCKMVMIPTIEEEDAKRPNRERESLVREQTRIVNRMKAALIRLGIRGFNPKLKNAAERLADLRTPEDEPIPPNTLAELRRDMERRQLNRDQIRQIEDARLERIERAPSDGPHAMVRLLARVIGVGIETADMLVQEVPVANPARPTGCRALCWPHWRARREWRETPGERAGTFWQRSSAARHDPIGVAISHVPEGQRLGAVVSRPHRERPWHSQDHDRGPGAQVDHCPVAPGDHWRGPGWRRIAGSVRRRARTRQALGA